MDVTEETTRHNGLFVRGKTPGNMGATARGPRRAPSTAGPEAASARPGPAAFPGVPPASPGSRRLPQGPAGFPGASFPWSSLWRGLPGPGRAGP